MTWVSEQHRCQPIPQWISVLLLPSDEALAASGCWGPGGAYSGREPSGATRGDPRGAAQGTQHQTGLDLAAE